MNTFRNPILPGFHPDPSLCRVGDDYYLATSSFQYFPAVPVFHSRDLVHWKQIGHCLTRRSQVDLGDYASSDGIWAPSLRWHAGRFYMIVSLVRRKPWLCRNFLVTATDPAGEWSEPVTVEASAGGIDPDLFFDDDGHVYYMRNGAGGIVLAAIDPATGRLLEETRPVWAGTGAPYPEGAHLYRREGWYYLLIAEGGTGLYHRACVARSRDLYGPYHAAPSNPILCHAARWMHAIQCTGHADLVHAHDDSWWAVFLAKRSLGFEVVNSVLGRETFLAPVTWSEEGWPTIGMGGHVELVAPAPAFTMPSPPESPLRDHFNGGRLGPEWNFLRNPREAEFTLGERPGWLTLHGGALDLDAAVGSPAWVGCRQAQFDVEAATLMEFDPPTVHDEAGLCVYMDEAHHYEVFLTRRGNRLAAVARRRIGLLSAEVGSVPVCEGRLILRIRSDADVYRLCVQVPEGAEVELARGETRHLQSPGFTGAYFALYATGHGRACPAPAAFDWFERRDAAAAAMDSRG